MNRRAEACYDNAPRWAQTLALNLRGLAQRPRFAAADDLVRELVATERWSEESQRAYVAQRLRKVLLHAVEFVPRYRGLGRLAGPLNDSASDVFEILAEFPLISRQEVSQRPRDFMSHAFDRRSLRANVTSGTTGSPLEVLVEPCVERLNDGLIRRRDVWAGYRRGDWVARLVGDPVVPRRPGADIVPYRISWPERRLYLSTYHLSRDTAPRFAELLDRKRPAFLMGYPSALEALSRESGRCLRSWRPKAVLFSSEPMYDHQRQAIRTFVDAPLQGFYGCAERVVSAAQCEFGTYHLNLVDGYVEGQFANTGAAPSSTADATPVTTLVNRAMPLIRYALGDTLACLVGETCPCGRTLPILSPVLTKVEDVVVTPTGRVVSPSILTWAFKDVPGLVRSQVVQTGASSLDVLVVMDESSPSPDDVLSARVGSMVFGEMVVTVRRVEGIALTSAGKTRFVVNEYAKVNQGALRTGVIGQATGPDS